MRDGWGGMGKPGQQCALHGAPGMLQLWRQQLSRRAAAAQPTSSPAAADMYTVAWLRSVSWARVLSRAPPLAGSSGRG